MSQEKQFYVYVHRYASGPKQGEVFYVGKGKGNRLNSRNMRNKHWLNIVNKYGFSSNIAMMFNSDECAFSFERALIAFYGRDTLCNMTDGGEGMSGHTPSPETRAKLVEAAKRRCPLSYEKTATFHRGRKRSDETRRKLSEAAIARGPTRTGAILSDETKSKIGLAHAAKTVYSFRNKYTREVFTGTQSELWRKFDLSRGNVAKLVRGDIHHNKGWEIYKTC